MGEVRGVGTSVTEWEVENLDLPAYLDRVRCTDKIDPTARTLRDLHRAHVSSIPFENIDVALGRPIALNLAAIQDKLVRRERGGYCHEHNMLFAAVLEHLGFAVRRLLARVHDDGHIVLPRGHMTLLVDADATTWLCDVGYGCEGLLEPIRLEAGSTIHQAAWTFGLDRREDDWILHTGGPSKHVLYSFADTRYRRPDFEVASYFLSTHPSSPFANQVVAQRATTDARYSLRGLELTITLPNGREARQRITSGGLKRVLADAIGVEINDAQAAAIAAFQARRP